MNFICDLTQFVISSITSNITYTNLAHLFMYEVIISFGMFSVVIIDYGRTFKQYFIKIYKDLKITLCVLYKVNHKGNKCENITILPTKYRQSMAMTESTKTF